MAKNKRASSSHIKHSTTCNECLAVICSSDEEDGSIQCNLCSKWMHFKCTKLSKKQLEVLSSDDKSPFHCHKCVPGSHKGVVKHNPKNPKDDIHAQYQTIISKLNDITKEFQDLREFVNFVNNKYDGVNKQIKKVVEENKLIRKENIRLGDEVSSLRKLVNRLESDTIKKQIIVKMDVPDNKSNVDIVSKIVEASLVMGNEIQRADVISNNIIKRAERKVRDGTKVVSLLSRVEFTSFAIKQKFIQNKRVLRNSEGFSNVYFFDVLSSNALALFNHAKRLKSVGYVAVFSNNGRVFGKFKESSKPVLIKDEDSVDDLLRKATTPVPISMNTNSKPGSNCSSSEEGLDV